MSTRTAHRILLKMPALAALMLVALAVPMLKAQAVVGDAFRVDIPPMLLSQALKVLADQGDFQIVFAAEAVRDFKVPQLIGQMRPEQALTTLLAGTSLAYVRIADTYVIKTVVPAKSTADIAENGSGGEPIRLAQNDKDAQNAKPGVREGQGAAQDPQRIDDGDGEGGETGIDAVDEVIVTGTHIRGTAPVGSPIIVIDRDYIDKSGYSSTEELFRSLPQNFSGGDSGATEEGRFGGGVLSGLNASAATGVNLRGLGNTSTLTLIDGRRLAPTANGLIVDISLIPLSAIERVEVMTDGASAIYGADAVGGVVNFILRKDLNAAQTRLRYGIAAGQAREELMAAQLMGGSWGSGSAIASLQYQTKERLQADERSLAQALIMPTDIMPAVDALSVMANLRQDVRDDLQFHVTGLYSHREIDRRSTSTTTQTIADTQTGNFTGAAGVEYKPSMRWRLRLDSQYARNRSNNNRQMTRFGARSTGSIDDTFELWSIDALASGNAVDLPAGEVGVAFGVSYRAEDAHVINVTSFGTDILDNDRSVRAVFGELLFPLLSKDFGSRFVHSLNISTALRHESYSDFGSTTNPRIGLHWAPIQALDIRASFNRSFRAPTPQEILLGNLDPTVSILLVTAQNSIGTVPVFFFSLPRAIGPEVAKTYSVGFDFRPDFAPGLTVGASHFDIRYRDRIITPTFRSSILQERDVFGSIITEFLSDVEAQAFLDNAVARGAVVSDNVGTGAANVRYAFDGGQVNASTVHQSGFDIQLSYARAIHGGTLSASMNSTIIRQIDSALSSTSTSTDFLDTYGNPLNLRIRTNIGWSWNDWSLNGAYNYSNDYRNTVAVTPGRIKSYSTFDLVASLSPTAMASGGLLGGVVFTLGIQNLLDRHPPFVERLGNAIHYDPANASILGRYISAEARKSW